jgi:hypothetical protein
VGDRPPIGAGRDVGEEKEKERSSIGEEDGHVERNQVL